MVPVCFSTAVKEFQSLVPVVDSVMLTLRELEDREQVARTTSSQAAVPLITLSRETEDLRAELEAEAEASAAGASKKGKASSDPEPTSLESELAALGEVAGPFTTAYDAADAAHRQAVAHVTHRRTVVPVSERLVNEARQLSASYSASVLQDAHRLDAQESNRRAAERERARSTAIAEYTARLRAMRHLPALSLQVVPVSGRVIYAPGTSIPSVQDDEFKVYYGSAAFGPLVRLDGTDTIVPSPPPRREPPLRPAGVSRFVRGDLRPVSSRRAACPSRAIISATGLQQLSPIRGLPAASSMDASGSSRQRKLLPLPVRRSGTAATVPAGGWASRNLGAGRMGTPLSACQRAALHHTAPSRVTTPSMFRTKSGTAGGEAGMGRMARLPEAITMPNGVAATHMGSSASAPVLH